MRSGSDSDLGSDVKEAATSSTCSESDCAANAEEETVGSRRRLRKSADVETDTEDEEVPSSAQQLEERRLENVKALVSGRLTVTRKSLLPRLLSVQDAEAILRQPFRSPHPQAGSGPSQTLRRKLMARRQFVPWGNATFVPLKLSPRVPPTLPGDQQPEGGTSAQVVLPPGVEPLVLWEAPPRHGNGEGAAAGAEEAGQEAVVVDNMLTQWLRPHQREGVQFMFECVCGLRRFEGQGCILADDMGLGKTLQGITLLWTLLHSGHSLLGGDPVARRVIICCPTSLVSNWDSECNKWLKGRVRTLPLCESSRDDVISSITQFLSPRNPFQVLIVSYETFRTHAERFVRDGSCDLLICDEAHRLKNDQTLTNKALGSLACRRRVLLSGTPLQNHLDEFYAMVSFCNPGVLGSPSQFRKYYELPILAGREPGASEEQVKLGSERSAELSSIVNEFILRRTNSLLSAHLPPKVIEVVCCRMTPLQYDLYCHFLQSKATKSLFSAQKAARVLSAITSLRKLLNHPKLIYDALHSNAHADEGAGATGFEDCAKFFPPGMFDAGRAGRGGMMMGWEALSGKFAVLARMLEVLRGSTKERIVIVSNYTQTLDLVAQLCREKSYPFLRLDGSTTITKRQKLVKKFNDPLDNQFVFLLSSKAGGCGLNLIGGSRLVLFDPDWNPANDKQAAGRVWRDGQKRRVFVYRFLATGTIEEKVYQRQLSKEGLQQVVSSKGGGGCAGPNLMSVEELRDLFSYDPASLSNTYESMCKGAQQEESHSSLPPGEGGGPPHSSSSIFKPQNGKPAEEDLQSWGHHSSVDTVPDAVMQQIGGDHISFIFTCQVEGKPLEGEQPNLLPAPQSSIKGSAENHRTPAACDRADKGSRLGRGADVGQPTASGEGASRLAVPSVRPTLPSAAGTWLRNDQPCTMQGAVQGQQQEQQHGAMQSAGIAVQQHNAAGSFKAELQNPVSMTGEILRKQVSIGKPCSMRVPDGEVSCEGRKLPHKDAAHDQIDVMGKENAEENTARGVVMCSDSSDRATEAVPAKCEPTDAGPQCRAAGRSLLSLPKRKKVDTGLLLNTALHHGQPTTGALQKRKLEETRAGVVRRVVCISDSDSDDDFV